MAAQTAPPRPRSKVSNAPSKQSQSKQSPKQSFALDVVKSAVAIPQPDPQDRLRVLVAASDVAMPLRSSLAKQLSKEGLRIEQELIARGDAPVASMMSTGAVDCPSVNQLVANITPEKVQAAEQTLIGAVSRCNSSVQAVQRLDQAAIEANHAAPRLTVALMDSIGPKAPWSQEQFENVFKALPSTMENAAHLAPDFATLYARMAPEVSVDAARSAGLKLLDWLAKMDPSDQRNLAVNVTTGAMKEVLKDNYDKALEADVMARQIAQTAGQEGSVDIQEEGGVSVLGAMSNKGNDRSAHLAQLPASQRAREAAASGFADGTQGDKKLASRYFDMAFDALNEVWENRQQGTDASAVVQEVSEAAAQVDPVNALQRARRLSDPTAQAIGMIAVARVVAAEGTPTERASQ